MKGFLRFGIAVASIMAGYALGKQVASVMKSAGVNIAVGGA